MLALRRAQEIGQAGDREALVIAWRFPVNVGREPGPRR
jgi:hypothetical protein